MGVNSKMGHVTLTTPLSGMVCCWQAGTYYDQSLHARFEALAAPVTKIRTVMQNLENGGFGVVRGDSRSSAMSPFDRVHTTSYSALIETLSILHHF